MPDQPNSVQKPSVRFCIHEKINNLRRVLTLLDDPVFQKYYTPEIDDLLYDGNIVQLRAWLTERRNSELETMTCKQLRKMAQRERIERYNFLDKEELIHAIKQKHLEQELKNGRRHTDH